MKEALLDKVVVITGASSGIGEATARTLAADGARIVAVARRKDRLDSLGLQRAVGGVFPDVLVALREVM